MYTNKEAKKYNGSDNEITEVDAVIEEVRQELRSLFVKTDKQIKKVGNVLKKIVKREESYARFYRDMFGLEQYKFRVIGLKK